MAGKKNQLKVSMPGGKWHFGNLANVGVPGSASHCKGSSTQQAETCMKVSAPCIWALTSFLSQTIKSDPVLLWKPFHQSLGAPSVTHVFGHPTALQVLEQPSSTGIRDRSHKKM